ncbi:MAG: tetratricopeptide repeat protein [Planctomycetia bacterium]|nr:tetratricopeptide repeat protein [Planctomycetia bacterium]
MATADELFLQGAAAHQANDLDTAERVYRQILEAAPNHAPSLAQLGALMARRGAFEEAERLYHAAIAANRDQLDAHFNLGNLYRRLGRPQDAAVEFEETLRIAPSFPPALLNLGLAMTDMGNWSRAVEYFARAVTANPDIPEGLNLLGDALGQCGRSEEAIATFRQSVVRFPDLPRGHYNLGLHLASFGASAEAIAAFERALALNPNYPDGHNALGVELEGAGRIDEAQREYREAVRLQPNFADAWANLGTSLGIQGQVTEAISALRQSLALTPTPNTHSALLTNLLHVSNVSAEELRDEHVAWAAMHADRFAPVTSPRKAFPGQPGRLRVGYVFAEFRSPTAQAFLEAVLTHHDRNQFHITAYPNQTRQTNSLDRIRRLADNWKPLPHMHDQRVADSAASAIRSDEIDILVDLEGHTPGNGLVVFARRPAPIQMSLFGYPATTGLSTMDYRITDEITDPPGQTEAFYVEKLLRLPDVSWIYVPPADAPIPNALPSSSGRAFTFGCLNHPAKLSDASLEAWAAVLKAVPKSRLVLLSGRSGASMNELTARFTQLGIASDRLELMFRPPESDYFESYQPIDLALDPFPYTGSSTTCDALWMGVPVLTVAGRDARARQGVSVLNAVGLPEFVADSPEQLVTLAATWADQRDALTELRASLREMVRQSPLTDAAKYIKHLEAAYRSVS